jgi:hypothetical protein
LDIVRVVADETAQIAQRSRTELVEELPERPLVARLAAEHQEVKS